MKQKFRYKIEYQTYGLYKWILYKDSPYYAVAGYAQTRIGARLAMFWAKRRYIKSSKTWEGTI